MRLQIPDSAIPTFTELSKLNSKDTEKIIDFLRQVSVGVNYDSFDKGFRKLNLSSDVVGFSETIYSFGSLLANENYGDLLPLVDALTEAFEEKKGSEVDSNVKDKLKSILLRIFKNSDNLKKTFKAFLLFTENSKYYRESRVITDMRPLFNDELDSKITCGVVMHQLKIEHQEDELSKSFYVSLTRNDVSELIDNLKRALDKEEIIKKNQTDINFIELK